MQIDIIRSYLTFNTWNNHYSLGFRFGFMKRFHVSLTYVKQEYPGW